MRKESSHSIGTHVRRLGRQIPSSLASVCCGCNGGNSCNSYFGFLESRSVMIMFAATVTVIACFTLWLFAPTQGMLLSFHGSYRGEHSARYRYGQSKKDLLDRVKGLESVLQRSVSDVKYHELRLLETLSHLSKKDSLIATALREVETAQEAYIQELRANPEQLAVLRAMHPESMIGRFGANITVRAEWREWLNECLDLRSRCEALETIHAAAAQCWWQDRLESLHRVQVVDGLTRLKNLLPFINQLHVAPGNASRLLAADPPADADSRARLEEFVQLWASLAEERNGDVSIADATSRVTDQELREETSRSQLQAVASESAACTDRLWDLCGYKLTPPNISAVVEVTGGEEAAPTTALVEDEALELDEPKDSEVAGPTTLKKADPRAVSGLKTSRDAYQINPRLYPDTRLDVSFVVEVRKGDSQHTAEIIDRLYACTEGRRGDGHLSATTSELVAVGSWGLDALDPAWEAAPIRTALGDFVKLLNVRPEGLFGQAAALSRGDFLVFMQEDAIPPANCTWLRDALATFNAWPRLGALGLNNSQYSYFKPHDEPLGAVRPSYDRKLVSASDPVTGVGMHFVGVADVGPIIVRREAFEEVGGWNDALGHPIRDGPVPAFDLCLRTWLAGYHVAQLFMPNTFRLPSLEKTGARLPSPPEEFLTHPNRLEAMALRERYDAFADLITAEVIRLNTFLDPGRPWDP